MLKILTKRLEAKVKLFIGEDQFGFRKGKGTREAIGLLRLVAERSLEHGKDVVNIDIGVDWRDRRLIQMLYLGQTAVV